MNAVSAMMRRSAASASDSPAPAAGPGSDATTGLGIRYMRPAVLRWFSPLIVNALVQARPRTAAVSVPGRHALDIPARAERARRRP